MCVSKDVFTNDFLNRSGTEEEYTELQQLLEDISAYNTDFQAHREEEQKLAVLKKTDDKKRSEEMRKAAMEGMSSMFIASAVEILCYVISFASHKRKIFRLEFLYI